MVFNLLTCSARAFKVWVAIAVVCLALVLADQGSASSLPFVGRVLFCLLGVLGIVKAFDLRRRIGPGR